jgi:putative glycosyltransferase (TIGR04348 family)
VKIAIVTPAAAGSRHGNRHTAARWARMLRSAGHRVIVEQSWSGAPADVLIALHARRSHESARRFKTAHADRPLVVVLTGTDLYRDIHQDDDAKASLHIADRLVVLQEDGLRQLSSAHRRKARVIYQSARPVSAGRPLTSSYEVVVTGHLRDEKDPFRTAAALAHLPPQSRIRVVHMGKALRGEMAHAAKEWMGREPRYRWVGEVTHGAACRRLARSRLMVISSRMEGGANVVSEALAAGVPVLASRVSGNIGMLGRTYSGYFPLADDIALARLLWRAESDAAFYNRLGKECAKRATLVRPEREARSLARLVRECLSSGARMGAHRSVGEERPGLER